MKTLHIALLGFGTVGKGVYQTIEAKQAQLQQLTGKQVKVATIVVQNLANYAGFHGEAKVTTNFQEVLHNPEIEIVMEAIVGKQPAFDYLQESIKHGKQVITANKEMFAEHGALLKELAHRHGVQIAYEATTAGGIPIIATIQQLLQVNQVKKIQAILNGTSNYILTAMRTENLSFAQALQQAQSLGYAEADPANDVDGHDAYFKAKILCELIFGSKATESAQFQCTGIRDISQSFLKEQTASNNRVKHLVTIEQNDGIFCEITPTVIDANHPLFTVEGVDNAIYLETDILGELTLIGPGAGALPTASAMVGDFCTIVKKQPNLMETASFAPVH